MFGVAREVGGHKVGDVVTVRVAGMGCFSGRQVVVRAWREDAAVGATYDVERVRPCQHAQCAGRVRTFAAADLSG
jgi:hypothetical protein